MLIHEAIDLLKTYAGPDELTLHPGANEVLIASVEHTYNITLPDDFKIFYSFCNGFEGAEDMFNFIPLSDIIEDKGRNNRNVLYIAEYMIYSDMWELEIDPDNPNKYQIIIISHYGNKLVLTNSLGDFTSRFLKGGVFNSGGLYEWAEEIESQSIYSTKPENMRELLTVYYYGLQYGIISRKEIIDWADKIIMHEDEPDHFFIEMSLSHDARQLLSVIGSLLISESSIAVRVILGILYYQLSNNMIDTNKVLNQINRYNFYLLLSSTEISSVYALTDQLGITGDEMSQNDELKKEVLSFLSTYKEFHLENYKSWMGINNMIEYKFNVQDSYTNGTVNAGNYLKFEYKDLKRTVQKELFWKLCIGAITIALAIFAYPTGAVSVALFVMLYITNAIIKYRNA